MLMENQVFPDNINGHFYKTRVALKCERLIFFLNVFYFPFLSIILKFEFLIRIISVVTNGVSGWPSQSFEITSGQQRKILEFSPIILFKKDIIGS